ncbi:MAG: 4Fe-4S dicluster domain-containing protein [Thermodesulfobacteriota bacterium]
MVYKFMVYIALLVFGIGLTYNLSNWFRFSIGINGEGTTPWTRVRAAFKGIGGLFTKEQLSVMGNAFVQQILLQKHIREQDRLRWIMHMLIFTAFTFLLIFHALDKIIVTPLFNRFYLVMNPWLITAGLIVLAGLSIALWRRYILKVPRLKTSGMDLYTIIILFVIILSGLFMEITKLSSYDYYQKIWWVHIIACLFGLAYLPFSKMFHMITTPLSLLANAVMDENSDPANIATRQVMELDACTHCNTCSRHCSVGVARDNLGNDNILPSERMKFLKEYVADKNISTRKLRGIQQGITLCTNCDRCTVVCPAGINLRELWFSVREEMIRREQPVDLMMTPFSYFRGLNHQRIDQEQYDVPLASIKNVLTADCTSAPELADTPIVLAQEDDALTKALAHSGRTESFAYCFSCENCSTVCPVVVNYADSQQNLDLLPHQIIRSVALGLKDLATGSRMLWNCLTCYQCQEHCPQGVKVTDIFNKLKTVSVEDHK